MSSSRTRPVLLPTVAALAALAIPAAPSAAAIDPPWQTLTATDRPADDPFVGVDADGTATMVWTEGGALFASTRPAAGHFGFPHPVVGVTRADLVAFDEAPDGAAVVAWTDLARHRVMAALRPAGAREFGAPVPVSAKATGDVDYFLDAAIGDDGTVALSWRRQVDATTTTSVQTAVARGGAAFVVTTLDASTDPGVVVENPDVGVDGSGRVVTVWDRTAQAGRDQLYAAIAPTAGFQDPFVVADVAQGPTDPTISVAPAGGIVLAYQDFAGTDRLAVRIGDTNGEFGPQQHLLGEGQAVVSYEVAGDDTGHRVVLASYSDGPDSKVGAAVSDDQGTFPGLTPIATGDQVTGPGISEDELAVTAAGSGEFRAFWEYDGDGTATENQAWSAATTGGAFGAPERLSPAGADVGEVVGSANGDGDVAAAWTTDGPDGQTVAQAYPATADTVPPVLGRVKSGPAVLHRGERWSVTFVPSEEVRATVRVVTTRGRPVVVLAQGALLGEDRTATFAWNGKVDGQWVRPGTYRFVVKAVDVGGNRVAASGRFEVR